MLLKAMTNFAEDFSHHSNEHLYLLVHPLVCLLVIFQNIWTHLFSIELVPKNSVWKKSARDIFRSYELVEIFLIKDGLSSGWRDGRQSR